MRKSTVIFLLALLSCHSVWAAGKLGEGEKRTLHLTPAVVLVMVTNSVTARWQVQEHVYEQKFPFSSMGSGFIFRTDGYIITNGHVVADANPKDTAAAERLKYRLIRAILSKIAPNTDERKWAQLASVIHLQVSEVSSDLKVYLANKRGYKAEIKAYSESITQNGKDVAILKIDANNLPTVTLGNSDQVHVQEPVTVIGYPGVASPLGFALISMESVVVPTVTNGHVSAVKTDFKGTPVIQSDAAITHGNSGGPAFNDSGEVIGIATFGPEVAGFNFFVPINTAWEFVRQSGAAPTSGSFNSMWSDALDVYDAGKCETAKAKFDDVLRIFPDEPDAQRLTAAAASCASAEGPVGRVMETSAWLLYLVLAAAGTGVAIVVLRRRQAGGAKGPMAATVLAGSSQASLPAGGNYGTVQVTSGSLSGQRFKITKAGLLVGRDPGKCQIVFSEDTVSKEHAWIVPLDNNVVVIDRGSSNGTYLNSPDSPKISKIGLQNGDRIYLGKKGAPLLTYFS